MDAIKAILTKEIELINKQEGRDGKPHFNSEFAITHRYLCLAMFVAYFAVIGLMLVSPYVGPLGLSLFTLFVLFVFVMMLVEIKPAYRFEDIGVLDLRVCYKGEWYFTRELSAKSVSALFADSTVNPVLKQRMKEIIKNKGEIDFYDVFDLAYSKEHNLAHAHAA